jgi:hypothetical protein
MTEFETATIKSLGELKQSVERQMNRYPVEQFPVQGTALRVLETRIQEAVKTVENLATLNWQR